MDQGTSGSLLNVSSLVDLKAELIRKQREAQVNKSRENVERQGKLGPKLYEALSKIKTNIKPVKNGHSATDDRISFGDEDDELDKKLAQSRSTLEAKACLYEKMCEGSLSADEMAKIYLVDFEKKSHMQFNEKIRSMPQQKDNDWVEYEDEDGNIRHCKQDELDWESAKNVQKKDNVHYQDVLGDEIRTHGVGYYAFSKEEEERQKQQMEFQSMRIKTEREVRKRKIEALDKKSKMEARLAKVRERKRLRAGLPLEDPDEKLKQASEDISSIPVPEIIIPVIPKEKTEDKLRKEKEKSYLNLKSVRPWDVEKLKTILPISMRDKLLSEDEYQERERQRRTQDFAPPTSYAKVKHRNKVENSESSVNIDLTDIENSVHIRLQEFRKQSDKNDF